MTTQNTITITDGPSKFDLMTALFVWKPSRPVVEFRTSEGTLSATIDLCKAEDGSGECWILEGRAWPSRVVASDARLKIHKRFKGFFRTSGPRTGWLKFIEQ